MGQIIVIVHSNPSSTMAGNADPNHDQGPLPSRPLRTSTKSPVTRPVVKVHANATESHQHRRREGLEQRNQCIRLPQMVHILPR